jgi:signal transduction histidine kinase
MKLISKTILYYLLISLPLLVIAGFLSYYLISTEVKDGTDESLWKEKTSGEQFLKSNTLSQTFYLSSDSLSTIIPIQSNKTGFSYSDSIITDKLNQEEVNYRILQSYSKINNQHYLITVARPTLEEEELMEGLLSSFALIIGFLVLAFFVVNWLLSKTLWKPFYKTLDKLNNYDLQKYTVEHFDSSTTKEFDQLNEALNKMTKEINEAFIQQKEFTENASHELQTPLAIIKANIGLLLQSPNLKAEEINQLEVIDNTTQKLASLNKALLLLAKIENHQFKEMQMVDMGAVVSKVIKHFDDLIAAKNINIENKIDQKLALQMNPVLADILITNLFQNAIRHNFDGGKIIIEIINNNLVISNTGQPLDISNEDLFVRFKKNDSSKESLGLGLSIVKSIGALYKINIAYTYNNSLHTFTLRF